MFDIKLSSSLCAYIRNLCSQKSFKDISDGVLTCPDPIMSCTFFPVNIAYYPLFFTNHKNSGHCYTA
jgi:hypothetical protein